MLKLHWVEIFLRVIPEMLLIIWGVYIVARKSIDMKNYILSSTVMALMVFFIRMLPIYYGVHMFINIILLICAMVIINGIPIVKAIYSTFIMFLILSLSEFFNVIILNLLNVNINIEFSNPIIKAVFGIPSLIITYLFIITIHYFIKRKEGLKNVANRKACS